MDDNQVYELSRHARKIIVVDLGFLGDSIHLLPALWMIHKAYPNAKLHVMVASHATKLFDIIPWVSQVWSYPRIPHKSTFVQDLKRTIQMRKERFDLAINVCGSQRTNTISFLSGAPIRISRIHEFRRFWGKQCSTHRYWEDYDKLPVFKQRLNILEKAGIPKAEDEFDVLFSPEDEQWLESLQAKPYIHLSPFASQDYKDLQLELIAHLIEQLEESNLCSTIITCAPSDREQEKFKQLQSLLKTEPKYCFPGNISVPKLALLIKHAKMHIGADSGSLHFANIFNTPSFSWFRQYDNAIVWQPQGQHHWHIEGQESPNGITGLSKEDLDQVLSEIKDFLKA